MKENMLNLQHPINILKKHPGRRENSYQTLSVIIIYLFTYLLTFAFPFHLISSVLFLCNCIFLLLFFAFSSILFLIIVRSSEIGRLKHLHFSLSQSSEFNQSRRRLPFFFFFFFSVNQNYSLGKSFPAMYHKTDLPYS